LIFDPKGAAALDAGNCYVGWLRRMTETKYRATITGVKHYFPYLYSFLAGFGTAMTVYFFRNK